MGRRFVITDNFARMTHSIAQKKKTVLFQVLTRSYDAMVLSLGLATKTHVVEWDDRLDLSQPMMSATC
jgi:hypothetical protein